MISFAKLLMNIGIDPENVVVMSCATDGLGQDSNIMAISYAYKDASETLYVTGADAAKTEKYTGVSQAEYRRIYLPETRRIHDDIESVLTDVIESADLVISTNFHIGFLAEVLEDVEWPDFIDILDLYKGLEPGYINPSISSIEDLDENLISLPNKFHKGYTLDAMHSKYIGASPEARNIIEKKHKEMVKLWLNAKTTLI